MSRLIPVLLAAVATAVAADPGPAAVVGGAQDALALRAGEPLEIEFDADRDGGRLARILVPERAVGLRLATSGATLDVDVYARLGEPPQPNRGLWDAVAADAWIDEQLVLSRAGALAPGLWYVWVAPAWSAEWTPEHARVTCTLRADVLSPDTGTLALEEPREISLAYDRGLWSSFRVAVPAGAKLRLEAWSEVADIDLAATPFPDGRRFESARSLAETSRSFERLVLPPQRDARDVFVHVYSLPSLEPPDGAAARVLATVAGDSVPTVAPAPRIPNLAPGASPLERAVAATVNLIGPLGSGSGVVVSPDGWVLSNAHVVAGAEAVPVRGADGLPAICAGFTLDPTLPAIETVGLELVETRRDLDLALLRIVSTVDGRPLPEGMRFPFVAAAPDAGSDDERSGLAPLGTPISILGYPMTGGSSTVLTITLTRGIVSGYAPEREGLVYKTDAAVHAGVSGGACVDAAGRLLGLPSASIVDANESGGLGYVLPVGLLPADWRARIGR